MTILEAMDALCAQLKSEFPRAEVALKKFSSGAAMLDVHFGEQLFVMAYFPKGGFGVDEVLEGEGFNYGYRFISKELDAATTELLRLLREADLKFQ